MAGIIDKLSVVQNFLNALTWLKIAQLVVFLFVMALAWATYDLRESIYTFASRSAAGPVADIQRTLTTKTIADIDAIVQRSELITGIQVVSVNFQKNTRNFVYTYTDSIELQTNYTRYSASAISALPLFNADGPNNRRIVDLINGEFVCSPYSETITGKHLVTTIQLIHTECSTGVPPYYGRFTGIVSVYLLRAPNAEEVDQIRTLSKNLASVIYDKDFK